MHPDRAEFRNNIDKRRLDSLSSIASSGFILDERLAGELKLSGSDKRCGVNLVCRPSVKIAKRIASVQNVLRKLDPGQYYYPQSDLHITLTEICHSLSWERAEDIAYRTKSVMVGVTAGLNSMKIDTPQVVFDAGGVSLNFLPSDGYLQSNRSRINKRLANEGIVTEARYVQKSAHISFVRYIHPLCCGIEDWKQALAEFSSQEDIQWEIDRVWLTWGANWYGMRSIVSEAGPYLLS